MWPVGSPSPGARPSRGWWHICCPAPVVLPGPSKLTPLLGGRYEKIEKLGQGSFGEVWLVLDTEALGAQQRYVAKIPFQGRQRQVPQGSGHLHQGVPSAGWRSWWTCWRMSASCPDPGICGRPDPGGHAGAQLPRPVCGAALFCSSSTWSPTPTATGSCIGKTSS